MTQFNEQEILATVSGDVDVSEHGPRTLRRQPELAISDGDEGELPSGTYVVEVGWVVAFVLIAFVAGFFIGRMV